eukprot:scaffold2042_cov123-Cylindrotheca_fusiformis.AAC.13
MDYIGIDIDLSWATFCEKLNLLQATISDRNARIQDEEGKLRFLKGESRTAESQGSPYMEILLSREKENVMINSSFNCKGCLQEKKEQSLDRTTISSLFSLAVSKQPRTKQT